MSLSIGAVVNDRALLPCVCRALGTEFELLQRNRGESSDVSPSRAAPTGYLGVGYYDQGEVLRSRRPVVANTSLFESLCKPASNCVVAHMTPRAEAGQKPVDAQPYRYKEWLWAMTDNLVEPEGFNRDFLALPTYIRGNLRTWRPEEVVFHLFLSFLHRTGALGSLSWDRKAARVALASAISLAKTNYVAESTDDSTEARGDGIIITTNGELLLAVGVDRPIVLQRLTGITTCAHCSEKTRVRGAATPTVGHPHLRAAIVHDRADVEPAPDNAGTWEVIEPGVVVEIDAALGVETGPLDG